MKSLELSMPHLLVVVGLPGAGKTFFAKQFSDTFGAPYVDYTHFHRLVNSEELGDIVATEVLGQLLLTKQTILVEGRGETKQDRQILYKLAHSKGYEALFVWVQTEPQATLQRAVKSKTASYTEDEYNHRVRSFNTLDKSEPHIVISGKHTYATQARMILKRLVAQRTATTPTPSVPPRPAIQKRGGRIIVG